MALNARPILSRISAFDAEFGETEAPVFKFSWSEGAVKKNRLRIIDYNNKEEVYNCIITTNSRTHKLHRESMIENRLINGYKYEAYITVFTSDDIESDPSEAVIFYCIETPIFNFTNFSEFSGDGENQYAIVRNSSLDCVVKYTSNEREQECLSSYYYELWDFNEKSLLYKSNVKYSTKYNDTLRFTVGGVKETGTNDLGKLKFDEGYTIRCVGETQNGFVINDSQRFIVQLPISGEGALIKVENIGDGRVLIKSNYKIMNVQYSEKDKNPEYITDEEEKSYAIDLTKGDYVEFIDGFIMQKPYEIIFKGIFQTGKLLTLRNIKNKVEGTNDYVYDYGYISLKKISYTTIPFYYFSFCIEKDGVNYEIRTKYFRYTEDIIPVQIPAQIDLSYYNGVYNIKANIFYEYNYGYADDNNGNVALEPIGNYGILDNEGNIELINTTIIVSDDNNSNTMLR